MTLLFLAALKLETSIVVSRLRGRTRSSVGSLEVVSGSFLGREAVVARTGVGPRRAGESARALLAALHPGAVISYGIAGGLSERLRRGDVVMATELLEECGEPRPARLTPDPVLASKARAGLRAAGLSVHPGGVLTVSRALCLPAEKDRAHAETGALAVEMESAAVARACADASVPWLVFRAVADPRDVRLPPSLTGFLDPRRFRASFIAARGIAAARRALARVLEVLPACLA